MTGAKERERIPHADRPAARAFCTCLWVHRQNPDDPEGPAIGRLHNFNPQCPLHGDQAQEAPY